MSRLLIFFCIIGIVCSSVAQDERHLPNTKFLTERGDFSALMVEGIDRFLEAETGRSIQGRSNRWQRNFADAESYNASLTNNRAHLRTMLGMVDPLIEGGEIEIAEMPFRTLLKLQRATSTHAIEAHSVRWPVFDDVWGEGLLLEPVQFSGTAVIALTDADQSPESIAGLAEGIPAGKQFARRLAEAGCRVLIPYLVTRENEWSGAANLWTDQPHREWIYRQCFELGRHIIGYEVAEVMGAASALKRFGVTDRIAVAGYGEGGLIALYAGALDKRIDSTLVSGYFSPRERLWAEPIYRNVFGLLGEFGDAELASMIAPRRLVIEYSEIPTVVLGPRQIANRRATAAPGKLATPDFGAVESEVERARLLSEKFGEAIDFVYGNEGRPTGPGSEMALGKLLGGQDIKPQGVNTIPGVTGPGKNRSRRAFDSWVAHTQRVLGESEAVRRAYLPLQVKDATEWKNLSTQYRADLWDVIGHFTNELLNPNPRSREVYDREDWKGYEIKLDVWPEVFAWGYLLVPKTLKPGERRPVIVCQHGLEGLPTDTIETNKAGFGYYKSFAARLASEGYIVYSPHNPYRGQDRFRVLQRKANPLGKSLFSIITPQHQQLIRWLKSLDFVDGDSIGFYGLSYGGKTAMRVPALLPEYALSICSADFNDWIRKNASLDTRYSYLYTGEYEMPEFNLGNRFNYAEMAALIAPRPFMVERGNFDTVAPDEWVAYEYAKVARFYTLLGKRAQTEVEFFPGPHTVNGVGTFKFLREKLPIRP